MSSDMLSPPNGSPSPHRGSLTHTSRVALLKLSPQQQQQHRHLRKLSQVPLRSDSITGNTRRASIPNESLLNNTIVSDEDVHMEDATVINPPMVTKIIVPECFKAAERRPSRLVINSPPHPPIDTVSMELAEHAADPNLSEQALANMEMNMRRISQESASPTVKGSKDFLSVGGKSTNSSFSLSFVTDDQVGNQFIMRSREEDCISREHTPIPINQFEPLSPASSSDSSLDRHLNVVNNTRRNSVHGPTLSVSDSGFNLLSPSNVSSGWEPPSSIGAPTEQIQVVLSPVSQKKKSASSWKFWKKIGKDKSSEKEEGSPMDTSSGPSSLISSPVLASSTMPNPVIPPLPVREQKTKSSTMPHASPLLLHSPPPSFPSQSPKAMALLLSPPKQHTPKNKASPKGGVQGRPGGHKRQKSARGDDVHSPRSGAPKLISPRAVKQPGGSPRSKHVAPVIPPKPTRSPGLVASPPVSASPPVNSPTPSVIISSPSAPVVTGSQTHRGSLNSAASPPVTVTVSAPSRGSQTARGSTSEKSASTKAKKDKPAPMELDPILASLMYSGLMGGDEPDSPKTPEPKNSYVDSAWETPEQTKSRPFPKAIVRPVHVISSWTRTVFSPHVILAPAMRTSPPPPTAAGSGSPPSGPLSPRKPLPPRSSSMIVYASPSCVSALSTPSSPTLTPMLLPPSAAINSNQAPSELRQIISGHSLGFLLFLRHLQREYASESLLFWKAAEDFLPLAAKEVQDTSEAQGKHQSLPSNSLGFSRIYLALYSKYLKPGASHEINISSSLRELLRKDAEGHEQIRQAWIAAQASKDAEDDGSIAVQRDPEALHQSSLHNLGRIEQAGDEQASLEGATLIANPIVALESPNEKYAASRRSSLVKPSHTQQASLGDITLDEMKIDSTGPDSKLVTPPILPTATSAALALSTYAHLLQSQMEIEKLLTQDCLPRFKHSAGWERWKKHQEMTEKLGSETRVGNEYSGQTLNLVSKTPTETRSATASPTPLLSNTFTSLGPLPTDKRRSCLLPTSVATSFTSAVPAAASVTSPPPSLFTGGTNVHVSSVPFAPPLSDQFSASSVSGGWKAVTRGQAAVSKSLTGMQASQSIFTGGIGGSTTTSAVMAGGTVHCAPSTRSYTIGASVFAEAAAAASLNAAARARAITQVGTSDKQSLLGGEFKK